jgi:hypothetical protein
VDAHRRVQIIWFRDFDHVVADGKVRTAKLAVAIGIEIGETDRGPNFADVDLCRGEWGAGCSFDYLTG